MVAVVRAARLSGEGEVVHAGGAEHGVVHSVASETAVAENLPGLRAGEDVLDAGADPLVGFVVRPFPVGQVFAFAAAVGRDEPGTRIAAVGDRHSPADLTPDCSHALQSLQFPGRGRPTTTTKAGVGVDDDVVIGGVPVVF